jgi:DNA-binding NtrC family response regulator
VPNTPARPREETAAVGGTAALGPLSARSSAMKHTFALLSRVASSEVSIVLVGEPGTGKRLLARTVHELSAHAAGPFVTHDCSDDAQSLLAEPGPFERARGGSLFLREIAELPLEVQQRLLRALEQRETSGPTARGSREVRLMASSTDDLRARVAAGLFRDDLYLGLASATVPVPPLRDRREDVPPLVSDLLRALGRPEVSAAADVFDWLETRTFPGNVRELKNALACALPYVEESTLEARHLLLSISAFEQPDLDRLPLGGTTLEELERAAIKQTLARLGGVKSRAAQALGIAVSTLY